MVDHVTTVGWKGIKNGRLLALMEQAGYDGLVTTDKNLGFQQDLPRTGVFVILIRAKSNRVIDLAPLGPAILRAIAFAQPGQVVRVGA